MDKWYRYPYTITEYGVRIMQSILFYLTIIYLLLGSLLSLLLRALEEMLVVGKCDLISLQGS